MALASSEQMALEVSVFVELVGRAQMMNSDDNKVASGSVF